MPLAQASFNSLSEAWGQQKDAPKPIKPVEQKNQRRQKLLNLLNARRAKRKSSELTSVTSAATRAPACAAAVAGVAVAGGEAGGAREAAAGKKRAKRRKKWDLNGRVNRGPDNKKQQLTRSRNHCFVSFTTPCCLLWPCFLLCVSHFRCFLNHIYFIAFV